MAPLPTPTSSPKRASGSRAGRCARSPFDGGGARPGSDRNQRNLNRAGNSGQIADRDIGVSVPAPKKLIAPSSEHVQNSLHPCEAYRRLFSFISLGEFPGESTSTQISGDSGRLNASLQGSNRPGLSAATSGTLTPSAVSTGHSEMIVHPGSR